MNATGLSVTDLLDTTPDVGTLPTIYLKLQQVVEDPFSGMDDVGAIVAEDPGLTARLLKLVNSAFFAFPGKIDTASQALSVVGMAQLQDLALATSVITAFENVPPELVDMDSFWRHSVACGVSARVIATELREPNVERLFVIGLLHDIGRLIIYMGNPEGARLAIEKAQEEKRILFEVEEELFGYDHAAVGRALLRRWTLPASIQEPVLYHHRPTKSPNYLKESSIVHVADIIAHALRMGSSGEKFVPRLVRPAFTTLDLGDRISESLLDEVQRQYDGALMAILGS